MKKKILAVLITAMLAIGLMACGNKDTNKDASEETSEEKGEETSDSNEDTSKMEYLKDFKASDFVELGDYTSIEVNVTALGVTDEELDSYILYVMQENPMIVDVTDRNAEMGDITNIDYEGKLDGVPFERGSAQGAELILGSGKFIEGFEDGVVGMAIGETKDVTATFPDPYSNNPDLAGKEVIFTVKLNSLTKEEVVSELTDEYAASFGEETLNTAEKFRQYFYDILLEQKIEENEIQKEQGVMVAIEEAATFKELPSGMTTRLYNMILSTCAGYAQMYGASTEAYVSAVYGGTEADYEATLKSQSEMMARRYIMLAAIAEKEGLSISNEEFDAQLALDASDYGYTNVEEYVAGIDVEAYKDYLLTAKVLEYLEDNVVVNEKAAEVAE